MKERRIVVDTNIVVSAFLSGGISQSILKAWLNKEFIALISDELKYEINEVLNRPSINAFDRKRQILLGTLFNMARTIHPKHIEKKVFSDPDDHFLLELAISGDSHCIVTGDQALLSVKVINGIKILSPIQFCHEFRVKLK